jgi:hypothetical protein
MPSIPLDSILIVKDCSIDIVRHPEMLNYPILDIGSTSTKFPKKVVCYNLLPISMMNICMELK